MQRCAIHGPRIVALEENDLFEKMSVLPHPSRDECFDLDVHGLALGAISPTSEVAGRTTLQSAPGAAPQSYALGIVTGWRKRLGGSVSVSE